MSKSEIDRFRLSSDDCELLVAFSECASLASLADRLGRDISVVSRQIKRMADRSPVLEKIAGRWRPTVLGEDLIHWSRNAMRAQSGVLNAQANVSIVTTAEFGARILVPSLSELLGREAAVPSIHCMDTSIEPRLLSGQSEFGFDCGRPESPLIKYKLVRNEPLAVVASNDFCKKYRIKKWEDLLDRPFVEYNRISPTRSLSLRQDLPNRVGSFNTIATARAAVLSSLGWSLLPVYSVSQEFQQKRVVRFTPETILHEQFGVWWLRTSERTEKKWIPRAVAWLESQDLG